MTFKIPIGPQHPALKEPINLWVTVDGEKITAVDIRLGYNHRGIEKAAESRLYLQDMYLCERICGICSFVHASAFCQGVEELAGLEVPKRGLYIRTLLLELERIHSHLLWLGIAGHEIGFDTFFMYTWRDRELVMDLIESITGNRVNYSINTIGGVRRDIDDETRKKILDLMKVVEERTKYYTQVASTESTFLKRTAGVGTLPKEKAIELCALGPNARGSGVDSDIRRDDPYAVYADLEFKVITSDRGDVLGRAVVRVLELVESCKMIRQLVENLPEGEIRTKAPRAPRKVPEGEVVSRIEAPRGEDIHYIMSDGTENPYRVKVRAPTLGNYLAVAYSLTGGYIADIPIVFAAIDPCMSCTDRIVVANRDDKIDKVMEWDELRKYGIEWYAHRR